MNFNPIKIKELEDKGVIRKKHNNLENYKLIMDYIEVGSYTFSLDLWVNGNISIQDIMSPLDVNAELENNRLVGVGARIYRKEILEAVNIFKEKYLDIINYLLKF